MALAGILIRGKRSATEAAEFVRLVAEAAGDEEAAERTRDVKTTAAKLAKGEPATGAPSLAKFIPEAVVRKAAEWLGIDWTVRAQTGRRPVLTNLSEVEPLPVEWLWRGRIPRGAITILDGDPGLGKSTLTLDLAARVTTARPMPDGTEGVPGGVVLLSAEDDVARTIVPRLRAAGADCSRVVAFSAVADKDGKEDIPSFPSDLSALEEAIERVGAVLVIIDPLVAYLDDKVNANKVRM